MPSLDGLSETLIPSSETKPKKIKSITSETAGLESSNKKIKKNNTTPQSTETSSDSEKSEKKIKRKCKASSDTDNDEGKSDTSSESGEPINLKIEESMKISKTKKMKVDEVDAGSKEDNPNAVSNFRISEPLRNALKAKGIEALFPIQARTFDSIYDGLDLIGKAKTGQGKTLAFILPILESLTNGTEKASRRTGYGRSPSILVLLPTRELAKQVYTDFKYYGEAVGLTSCCLYGGGGASISPQTVQLKRGVDVVVGAVGRVKDHIERGNLDLCSLKFRILDEADEMLRQGYVEDVEYILGKVNDATKVQTVLFSATLPAWVNHIASKFLKANKKIVDPVGVEVTKASENVRHSIMPCSMSARSQVIPDIIHHHSGGGHTIVFTETKDYCSELSGVLQGPRPLSDTPPLPHKPPNPLFDRKNSFGSLKHYLPRTWLIFSVFFLQILLLLVARNFHKSTALTSQQLLPDLTTSDTVYGGNNECPSGKVFVYNLPPYFNTELLDNCHELNPWGSRCDTYSNDGLGRMATNLAGVIPESLIGAWFWTDQFASEIIYHNRMLNYQCRTLDAESATAFYIPFYAGLAVGKYLWTNNYTAVDRDRHCHLMLKWVHDQPYWKKSDGWDHFITMGRITWDFRRSKDEDWGSRCIYLPGMRNITRLLIERNSWDYFDVGVPYPTGFHPRSPSDVATWQNFVRTRTRSTLFCFAGATRGLIKNDFRGLLLNQCYNSSGSCRVVDCGGSRCSNGTSLILESFLGSDFCLQPRGDSFTRRSIFDCMIAGSIPVFFWNRTAYSQYEWFLPGQPESYSVFIDKKEVLNGKSIKGVLDKFGKDEVSKMRDKVIEYIPRIVYAKPHEGLGGMKDAFDLAVQGVLNRIKDQQKEGFKW